VDRCATTFVVFDDLDVRCDAVRETVFDVPGFAPVGLAVPAMCWRETWPGLEEDLEEVDFEFEDFGLVAPGLDEAALGAGESCAASPPAVSIATEKPIRSNCKESV